MRIKPKYYILNNHHVAMIGKSGNTSIGKAAMFNSKPNYQVLSVSGNQEIVNKINNGPGAWQAAPKTDDPIKPLILVRDPIERFRSACAQDRIGDINKLLDRLDKGITGYHYRKTCDWLVNESRLYKFPEHVDEIASALGLDNIPHVNDSDGNNPQKPDLTKEQIERLESIYKDDIDLYNSITTAGQVYTMPDVVEEIDINQETYEKVSSIFSDLPRGKQILWNITITEVLKLVRSGEFKDVIEILETTPSTYSGAVTDRNNFISVIPN